MDDMIGTFLICAIGGDRIMNIELSGGLIYEIINADKEWVHGEARTLPSGTKVILPPGTEIVDNETLSDASSEHGYYGEKVIFGETEREFKTSKIKVDKNIFETLPALTTAERHNPERLDEPALVWTYKRIHLPIVLTKKYEKHF